MSERAEGRVLGYARVSSTEQRFGITVNHITSRVERNLSIVKTYGKGG